MLSVHYAEFAREFLEELYGEDEVAFFKKNDNIDEHTMCIGGLFSIRVGSDGEYHLYTSRQLGPDRNFSGLSLDLLVAAAAEEYPAIKDRQIESEF